MKSKLLLLAIVALVLTSNANRVSVAQTNWKLSSLADRNLKPEEKRLKDFWTAYYGALKSFYGNLDHLDWVVYYQNHGFKINVGAGPDKDGVQRTQYAPVYVAPTMQWAVPNDKLNGPLVPLWRSPPKSESSENPTEEKKTETVAGSAPLEYKAASFGSDATENTKILK